MADDDAAKLDPLGYSVVRTLTKIRTFRIEEAELAASTPPVNFLRRYDKRLSQARMMLGDPDKGRMPHLPLYDIADVAEVAAAVSAFLEQLEHTTVVHRAADAVASKCLAKAAQVHRSNLRSAAEDAAVIAIDDAVLYAVERYLRRRAASRRIQKRASPSGQGWSQDKRDAAAERARSRARDKKSSS
jgi:hypothetical protein